MATGEPCPDGKTRTVEGEQFAAEYAEAYCDLRRDCYPEGFSEEFERTESCERAGSKREIQEDCDGCVLGSDIGEACVGAAQTISCTDWVHDGVLDAACDGRWDCSDSE